VFENIDANRAGGPSFVLDTCRIARLNCDGWRCCGGGFPGLVHKKNSISQVTYEGAERREVRPNSTKRKVSRFEAPADHNIESVLSDRITQITGPGR
jgi:hypothetical protein